MNSETSFVLKGDIAYSENQKKIKSFENAYLVCADGISKGVFCTVPEKYQELPLLDYTGKLIIPGLVDLHIHAPQFAFRGTHMDLELLDWLQQYTFPEEAKYSSGRYARKAYSIFADALKNSATTRACVFGTMHIDAAKLLMELIDQTGLGAYVGKVNMDRVAPADLLDPPPELNALETADWINETQSKYRRVKPILTPRFIPSCTNELLSKLKTIVETYKIPVQSHLSENPDEVEFVKALMPEADFYGDAYDRYSLFGSVSKTVMAHCVYSVPEEVELMKKNGVYIAHCPSSNMNLGSGIAPIRKYLDAGMHVGIGSDVAGGESESLFNEMKKAIEVSKMYRRYIDEEALPLTMAEAFWMATLSGGSFFGKVGSFEEGFEADIVILDDSIEAHPQSMSVEERLERSVYLGVDKGGIAAKFVAGERII